ncbi:MAG: hypothetical protein ACXV74_00470 [Methylobacter sp.]
MKTEDNNKGTESVFVFINGIMVGCLQPEQYESFCATVRQDWRLYVMQLLNYGYAAFLVSCLIFIITPILFFWILVILDVYAQAEFVLIIEAINKTPEHVPLEILTIIRTSVILSILAACFGMFFYKIPGLKDVTFRKERWYDVEE